jgi:hypothetical protein
VEVAVSVQNLSLKPFENTVITATDSKGKLSVTSEPQTLNANSLTTYTFGIDIPEESFAEQTVDGEVLESAIITLSTSNHASTDLVIKRVANSDYASTADQVSGIALVNDETGEEIPQGGVLNISASGLSDTRNEAGESASENALGCGNIVSPTDCLSSAQQSAAPQSASVLSSDMQCMYCRPPSKYSEPLSSITKPKPAPGMLYAKSISAKPLYGPMPGSKPTPASVSATRSSYEPNLNTPGDGSKYPKFPGTGTPFEISTIVVPIINPDELNTPGEGSKYPKLPRTEEEISVLPVDIKAMSSDEDVAQIINGVIVPVSNGTATITVQSYLHADIQEASVLSDGSTITTPKDAYLTLPSRYIDTKTFEVKVSAFDTAAPTPGDLAATGLGALLALLIIALIAMTSSGGVVVLRRNVREA